jgi:two-component system response regulator HydG
MADRTRVLIVDDKLPMAETIADGLSDRGYDASATGSSRDALARLGDIDLLVTDLRMPELDGFALLDAAHAHDPALPVIVMTAYGAIDSAVEAIRKGAFHYLTKPFKIEELAVFVERACAGRALQREAAALRRTLGEQFSVGGLIGRSAAMQKLLAVVERIAPTDVPVLLTGETGAGKGAVARVIHGESKRARGSFVAVNCAALPEQLLESELFGHVKGAFTGATADRAGLFADAEGGTLLLDEIAEMSPALQAKLLHALEGGSVRAIGGREREVNVRVIAATHRDLRARIAAGTFREDLLYRLEVVALDVPALRHRRDDIPVLLAHFLADAQRRHGSAATHVTGFGKDALARLYDYAWPGNVRELAHVVERCALLAAGPLIGLADLPAHVAAAAAEPAPFSGDPGPMRELQRRYARWALDHFGGHKGRTADALDVDAKTLNRWLADDAD